MINFYKLLNEIYLEIFYIAWKNVANAQTINTDIWREKI